MIYFEKKVLGEAPVVGSKVQARSKNGAVYARGDGRKWVRKTRVGMGSRGFLAEAMGWLFATQLDLPIPDVAVYLPGDYRTDCWLSEVVESTAHWSTSRFPVANLEELGGVLAADVILANADRHSGNILLQPQLESGEEFWKAWCIDFDSALIGEPEDFVELGQGLPSTKDLPKDLPFEILQDPALRAAEKIAEFDDRFITSSVADACQLANHDGADELAEALGARCANAVSLVDEFLDSLRNRS